MLSNFVLTKLGIYRKYSHDRRNQHKIIVKCYKYTLFDPNSCSRHACNKRTVEDKWVPPTSRNLSHFNIVA